METYDSQTFSFFPKENFPRPSKRSLEKRDSNIEIFDTVMPLHQVIRFANQAAKKNELIYVIVEQQINRKTFQRTKLKGSFRTPVNKNRQIAFESADKKILFLLPIESILSIQLAVS